MEDKNFYFNKLLDYIQNKLNINLRQYNEPYIRRRLNSRLISYDLEPNDYSRYLSILETNKDEIRKLFDALTINVTKFFRDTDLWQFLKSDVFPRMLREKKEQGASNISIWSCGCASGEEPYSIAILFKELLKNYSALKVEINATDIDETSIIKAKSGIYDAHALEDMPKEYVERYFNNVEGDVFKLDPSIKQMVNFGKHNFFNDPPPVKNLDMIFCRNVIIYFTPDSKGKLVSTFFNNMAEHGWFTLGESEILFSNHMRYHFYLYDEKKRIYRKERRKNQVKVEVEKRKNWWYGYAPK
jgi:chemotaxis methyl-accepting protein methylase